MSRTLTFSLDESNKHQVIGCVAHNVGPDRYAMLQDPSTYSMASLRGVVDRMVSGFLYTAPHSPPCAMREDVVRTFIVFGVMKWILRPIKSLLQFAVCYVFLHIIES